MGTIRATSSPELCRSPTMKQQYDDSALEGVAAHVKLLLKLIQDHKDACNKERKDSRRMLRVATMMTILDNVRTRIQKCQSFGNKRSEAELRRSYTDFKTNSHVPRDKRTGEPPVADEKERLQKELNSSLAARKSLEVMCTSLGKEKEIMAAELARNNYKLSELEEHINDLKAQNETLLEKVKEFAAEQTENKCDGEREAEGNAALQECNKVLSQELLRSLDSYRSMKRKLREVQEETLVMRETMEEMSEKVGASLQQIRGFKKRIDTELDQLDDIEGGISELEHVFQCLDTKVYKHVQREG